MNKLNHQPGVAVRIQAIKLIIGICLLLPCWLGRAGNASAQSVLGQFNIDLSGGSYYSSSAHWDISLGYDISWEHPPFLLGVCLGCSVIPTGSLVSGATFDFNATNSAAFADFRNRLTDSAADTLWFLTYDDFSSGSGQGKSDIQLFPTANTWRVDSARLTVNSFSTSSSGSQEYFSINYTWQIYGDIAPVPVPVPVPEPETYAMLLAGLGLIGVIGRRRHSGKDLATQS